MIYLDNAATTPMYPEVIEAMLPFMVEQFGNPSSIHTYGQAAKVAVNRARDQLAQAFSCLPKELVFTSGGTESDNTAIFGAAAAQPNKKHIITSTIEHHAVLQACERLEQLGYEITYLPVNSYGQVRVEDVEQALRPDTALITIMYGNNEVGTLQPIHEIGTIARQRGVIFHVDAVQALGVVPLKLNELPVDAMSFSAHKIRGPKGVGALYISQHTQIAPLLVGGSQERKRRAGTENVAGLVGFSKALQLAFEQMDEKLTHFEGLRQTMLMGLNQAIGSEAYIVNGHPTEYLPHILNVSFPGIDSETMLMNLDLHGVCAASGSACTSGSLEVSHVLEAMNLPTDITQSSIRFSFGLQNTIEEIEATVQKVETITKRIRNT